MIHITVIYPTWSVAHVEMDFEIISEREWRKRVRISYCIAIGSIIIIIVVVVVILLLVLFLEKNTINITIIIIVVVVGVVGRLSELEDRLRSVPLQTFSNLMA